MGEDNLNHIITVKEIIEITKGTLVVGDENTKVENFRKNTNDVTDGDFYVGFVGTKNGGIYFEDAFKNGAKGVIIQDVEINEEQKKKYSDKNIIIVKDVLEAFQEIAKYKRSLYKDLKIVAVTGSVGKTSTKDIIANVLSQKYKTLKTEGNYNNHIGVPLTLMSLENHEVAVIEMGMNHLGEISLLSNIAKPNLCVITNVGTAHIGILGSRQNILKAKLEILDGNEEKEIVINNDNDLLNEFCKNSDEKINTITYGIDEKSKVYATNIKENEEDSTFTCNIDDESFQVKVPVAGRHFIYNALCAAAVGNKLGLTNDEIKRGIETFKLTKKRMDIDVLENGAKIINDSYNASFESMKASLENLSRYTGRKIAVLGDMFELGDYSEELHSKVGLEVSKNNIDILICAGENAKFIVKSAKENGMNENNIFYFSSKEEILEKLKEIINKDDVILFKASNGMKFFEIVSALKGE